MIWNSAADFLAMGGYGLYVWGSYGLMALLMATEPLLAARRRRQALQAVRDANAEMKVTDET
jgi:heme exporter protein D